MIMGGFDSTMCRASTALQVSLRAMEKHQCQNKSNAWDIFEFLYYHGAVINAMIPKQFGRSELARAVETEDLAIMQKLLGRGANVNSPPCEEDGRTALEAAAGLFSPNIYIVELLLQSGTDVNAPASSIKGFTALGGLLLVQATFKSRLFY